MANRLNQYSTPHVLTRSLSRLLNGVLVALLVLLPLGAKASQQADFNQAYKNYVAQIQQQHYAAALPFAKQAYELGQQLYPETDSGRLAMTDNYAVNLMVLDKNNEAASVFTELLRLTEIVYGSNAAQLQPILDDLVEVSRKAGIDKEQIKALEVRRYKLYLRHNSWEFIEQFGQDELATTQHTKNLQSKLEGHFEQDFAIYESVHWSIVYHPDLSKQVAKVAKLMEKTYNSSLSYLVALNLRNKPLDTKMTAVYLKSRADYISYVKKMTKDKYVANKSGGLFSFRARASFFYDRGLKDNGKPRYPSASLVVHESAHQVLYAFGLNSSQYVQPRWLKEGLAVAFEAHDFKSGKFGPHTNNYSFGRMTQVDKLINDYELMSLSELVTLDGDDEEFRNAGNQPAIYAVGSMAVRFFYEYYPEQFKDYLVILAKSRQHHNERANYGKNIRLKQFKQAFGDPAALDDAFKQYVYDTVTEADTRRVEYKKQRKAKNKSTS
ncbi:DUF1570 domain-containing protein [Neiella marina]|uniref:DUF1570 domain-containing protein n=1 Tax=Neiella holothuriorum TaxID=2870530 RepID=A0ABS7EJS4_9GAMM|nr:DUF1570 domain-containing protein [Neiella holothuriorum]MBW8192586.1 DUF1570 domain-containing protein [Neiella holothuriorum]